MRINSQKIIELDHNSTFRLLLSEVYDAAEKLGISIFYDEMDNKVRLGTANGAKSETFTTDAKTLRTVTTLLNFMLLREVSIRESESTQTEDAETDDSPTGSDQLSLAALAERLDAVESALGSVEQKLESGPRRAEVGNTGEEQARLHEFDALKILQRRARSIGNSLHQNVYGGGYTYIRVCTSSFDAPFKFLQSNAYDPLRRHYRQNWYFGADELELLRRFMEHDEEIYKAAFAETSKEIVQ